MDNNAKTSKYLFFGLMLFLLAPFLQSNLNYFQLGKLGGHVKKIQNIELNQADWFASNYQNQKELYLKNNFGFRNWAIRMDHQWAYSAYRKPKAWAVIGKEDYLFQPMYISARKGTDYLGDAKIADLAKKMKAVQDTLTALGKAFVFVITPSKADYYAEYLWPKDERANENVPTNYGIFKKEMLKNKVQLLDLNEWFLQMKDTTPYPLFPKTGIHYSDYGAAISANRIIKEVERQLGKDLPEYEWNELNCTKKLGPTARDLEDVLNLMFYIPNHEMCYPKYFVNGKGKYRPHSITISDSFFWQMMSMGISWKIFKKGQFWLYNRDLHPGGTPFGELDLGPAVKKAEVIFIMETPGTMKNHLVSFVEVLYNYYYKGENFYSKNGSKEVREMMVTIKGNKKWFASIKAKAKKVGISVDQMLMQDAKFFLRKKKEKQK